MLQYPENFGENAECMLKSSENQNDTIIIDLKIVTAMEPGHSIKLNPNIIQLTSCASTGEKIQTFLFEEIRVTGNEFLPIIDLNSP